MSGNRRHGHERTINVTFNQFILNEFNSNSFNALYSCKNLVLNVVMLPSYKFGHKLTRCCRYLSSGTFKRSNQIISKSRIICWECLPRLQVEEITNRKFCHILLKNVIRGVKRPYVNQCLTLVRAYLKTQFQNMPH